MFVYLIETSFVSIDILSDSKTGLQEPNRGGGVGGSESEDDNSFVFSNSFFWCFSLELEVILVIGLSLLRILAKPHLAHFKFSVGFIKAHSEQCHCNTDAIEPIL